MDKHGKPDIVVIGASAGGIEALLALLPLLPANLPATVLIAVHRAVHTESILPAILARKSALPIVIPEEGEFLKKGVCYIGEPDRHLVVGPGVRARLLSDGFYR